jgi:hypothetical protein
MYLCSEVVPCPGARCEHLSRLSKALRACYRRTASQSDAIAPLRIDSTSHDRLITLIIAPNTTLGVQVRVTTLPRLETRFGTGHYTRAARGAVVRTCSVKMYSANQTIEARRPGDQRQHNVEVPSVGRIRRGSAEADNEKFHTVVNIHRLGQHCCRSLFG